MQEQQDRHEPQAGERRRMTLEEAVAAHKSKRTVIETLPSGAQRAANFVRRGLRKVMKARGLTGGRQKRKLRKAIRRGEVRV